jgi:hypothetical protein
MRSYRLEFEYLSPFTGKWEKTFRESQDLADIMLQRNNQLLMSGVRGSKLFYRDNPEWREFEEPKR